MPVEDRAADAWEPLIAIADEAQGDWPRLAREACKALSAEADEAEVDQTDILLIRDIDAVFTGRKAAFLGSQELVDGLREIKDSPWVQSPIGAGGLLLGQLARFIHREQPRSVAEQINQREPIRWAITVEHPSR